MVTETQAVNTYEGMYIFDPASATEWADVEKEVKRLMERAKAELMFCHRWDDRRLAYEIKGRKRGCYVLTYFKAPATSLESLQRDAQLSETILRALFLRADTVTQDKMETPPKPGSDSPRGRGGDRWERDDRGGDRRDRRDRGDRGDRRRDSDGDAPKPEGEEKKSDAGAPAAEPVASGSPTATDKP